MLNPGPGPVTLLVEGLVRTVEFARSGCLTQDMPLHTLRFCLRLSLLAHVGFVAVDYLLLTVQTHLHQGRVMGVRSRDRHTMHQTLWISPDMRLHTEIPLVPLLR